MVDLTIGTTTFGYTGAAEDLNIIADGTITVDLWGGAGGGGYFTGSGGPGGAGGYTRIVLNVFAGDVLRVMTGQGGRKSPGPVSNGGVGGWPDGGSGGAYAPLASTLGTSGGGGSSRIYINSVLVAVAGAGGGGLAGGGAGGGTNGLDAPPQSGVDNTGSGGTQTQGGYRASFTNYSLTPTLIRGSSLQGGHGWGDGSGGQNTNNSTPSEYTGCGGGGGYYGGAGGRAGERQFPSGGGGSSYRATALGNYVSGSTTAGSGGTPYDGVNSDRPAGIGVGGTTAGGTQTDGGNGYVRVLYEAADSPGNASGSLVTITVTAPEADTGGAATGSGSPGTVSTSAPEATATGEALASGDIGTITAAAPDAQPVSSALVIVPINDDVEIALTPAEATAEGGFTPIEVPLPSLSVFAPEGVAGVSIDISGDIGVVTVTPPEGEARPGVVGYGDLGTVTLTPPAAVATGAAVAIPVTIGEGDNRVMGTVLVGDTRAPQAFVTALGEATGDPLTAIAVTPPEATAEEGISGIGEAFPEIAVTPPEAVATSGVNIIPPTEGSLEGPSGVYLKLITTAPPAATATGEVLVEPDLPIVRTTPPSPILLMGASVVVAMPRRVEVRPPQGAIIFEGEALASGDFSTIDVTPPEASVLVDNASADAEAIGELPVITVSAPAAEVSFAGSVVVPLPTVYCTVPDAYVEVRDEDDRLPADFAPLRFKRTSVPGRAPTSLEDREIALNEADGVLFSRDSEGEVRETDYRMLAAGGFAPDGGSDGEILDVSGAWVVPDPVYDVPIRVPEAPGSRIALVEAAFGSEIASVTADRVYFRPFFVARTLEIADLAVEVVSPDAGVAHLGICGWSLAGSPGEALLTGSVSTGIAGLRPISGGLTLSPGWYAAMFAFTGLGTPTFRVARVSAAIDADFQPIGDPRASFVGNFDPPPAPTGFETAARGYLSAECA